MSKAPKSEKRGLRQGGILVLLCCVFIASGLLRLGNLNFAFAATDAPSDMVMPGESADEVMAPRSSSEVANLASIEAALEAIEGRAAELDAREADLEALEANLEIAQGLVEERLAALEDVERRLSELLTIADSAADSDIAQLTTLYESMPPDDAAELFAQMDPSFAAGFLSRMRAEAGAGILAELSPEQAYAISFILATRNAEAPRAAQAAREEMD